MKRRKKQKKTEQQLTWDVVEKYLKEESKSGAAMALVETEKILHHILDRLQYEGKDIDEKLLSAKKDIANYQDLRIARRATKRVTTELYVTITPPEAREIMKPYLEAIRILTKSDRNNSSIFTKIKYTAQSKLPSIKQTIITIFVGLFVFFLGVFLVDSTEAGKTFGEAMINISRVLFSWILFTILLVVGIITIATATIFYFESQRRKNSLSLTEVEKENSLNEDEDTDGSEEKEDKKEPKKKRRFL